MKKALGICLILAAVLAFGVNFGIVSFVISNWVSSLSVLMPVFNFSLLWNPLGAFASMIAGTIPLFGGAFVGAVTYILAIVWSIALFVVGLILAK